MPHVPSGNFKLYFEEVGDGYPILFIHEYAGDHTSWEPQMRYFSRRYRCVAYNARGYPPSDVPESGDDYGQNQAVSDAVAVMDHLGIDKAHIVGNSVGGTTTIVLALNHPDRVRSIVVGACHASSGGDPYLIANRPVEIGRVAREFTEDPTWENMRKYLTTTIDQDSLVTDELVNYMHELYTSHPDHLAVRKRSKQTPHSNMADLPNVKAPTLIIHGRYDRMVPVEVGLTLMNYITDSRLVVFNHCGSWPPFENPEEYANLVLGFLKGH